jgi:hypothetical protein
MFFRASELSYVGIYLSLHRLDIIADTLLVLTDLSGFFFFSSYPAFHNVTCKGQWGWYQAAQVRDFRNLRYESLYKKARLTDSYPDPIKNLQIIVQKRIINWGWESGTGI